jgi:hypothetical protein
MMATPREVEDRVPLRHPVQACHTHICAHIRYRDAQLALSSRGTMLRLEVLFGSWFGNLPVTST